MKKLTTLMLSLIMTVFISTSVCAQQAQGQSVVGLHAGYSLVGALATAAGDAIGGIDGNTVDASATPALQLAFDYGLTKRVSVGLAASFQTMSFKADNYSYVDAGGMTVTEDAKASSTRMSFALRTLFHYGNNDKLDMYSGIRIQRVQWASSFDSTDENFSIGDDFDGGRFGVGIIPFGLRYYFTDALGAGFELMWGAPYLASLNINYRLGESGGSSSSSRKRR